MANLIAKSSGFFVGFAMNRLQELLAELEEFGLGLFILRQSTGHLADMLGLAMDVLQQLQEFILEDLVVVGAAEPTGVTKVDKLDPAHITFAMDVGSLLDIITGKHVGGVFAGGFAVGFGEVFVGADLAEVEFIHLVFAHDFRDM
jgi:hypothetical protein